MTKIAELWDRDLSRPIEEIIKVSNDDEDTVYTELTEYVATDRITAEYERLFRAMAEAPGSPNEGVGVWISGFLARVSPLSPRIWAMSSPTAVCAIRRRASSFSNRLTPAVWQSTSNFSTR